MQDDKDKVRRKNLMTFHGLFVKYKSYLVSSQHSGRQQKQCSDKLKNPLNRKT